MLRYGFLLPTLVSREQRETIGRIIVEKTTDEPFFYIDEWLKSVGTGQISPSAVDEIKHKGNPEGGKLRQQIDKLSGNRDLQLTSVKKPKYPSWSLLRKIFLKKLKISWFMNISRDLRILRLLFSPDPERGLFKPIFIRAHC